MSDLSTLDPKGMEAATKANAPRPLSEWHDDVGPCLWWRFPVAEPPYVGDPMNNDWPGYHTHFTRIPVPTQDEVTPKAILSYLQHAEVVGWQVLHRGTVMRGAEYGTRERAEQFIADFEVLTPGSGKDFTAVPLIRGAVPVEVTK